MVNRYSDSENIETQSEGLISDSDEEYLPENDSEASSYEEESDESSEDDERPSSPALHASLHTFFYLIPLLTSILILFWS
ncbi:hypothetical protein E2C01_028257 [Portunus trituberculatus]|uniref:Uncharacterized protein n=1 Tax=Portunus trituberculatus TaxID=210409 RepID=A0A5B7ER52_PORTR|nr:hypothetical protein [Portunus trituberculatus]